MTVRSRLVTALFLFAALFASQVNAQGMIGITNQQSSQGAYQALQAALQSNTSASEAVDEAAVEAARAAGLSEEQIAGAMQESGRSVDQQVAALLPANPTQAQADAAARAVSNATNSSGIRISSVSTVSTAQLSGALQNAGVPQSMASTAANNATGFNGFTGGLTFNPLMQQRLNNLPATGAGSRPTFTPTTNLGGGGIGSSGPNIQSSANITGTPVIPVSQTTPTAPPVPVIPEPPSLHVI